MLTRRHCCCEPPAGHDCPPCSAIPDTLTYSDDFGTTTLTWLDDIAYGLPGWYGCYVIELENVATGLDPVGFPVLCPLILETANVSVVIRILCEGPSLVEFFWCYVHHDVLGDFPWSDSVCPDPSALLHDCGELPSVGEPCDSQIGLGNIVLLQSNASAQSGDLSCEPYLLSGTVSDSTAHPSGMIFNFTVTE